MASTSTNKQPMLMDRVLYEAVAANTLASGDSTSLDIQGTNESALLVDCTQNDGAIIEDMFTIARSSTPFTALFYYSGATDYLRSTQAVLIGSITSAAQAGDFTNVYKLPRVLAPVPHVALGDTTDASLRAGEPLRNEALYIPRGKALWVTLQLDSANADPLATPIIGVQGGYF